MKNGFNRYNHNNNKVLTPRQKQNIFRKFCIFASAILVAIILSVFISGLGNKAKAADNYYKYYTSIEIMTGDTLTEYYQTYGEHFKNIDKFVEEVCIINAIKPNDLKAGNYIILPYYSQEIK